MESEIAKLRQQLYEVCEAMHLGMYGLAIVAKHEFITRKYDLLGQIQQDLAAHVGQRESIEEIIAAIDKSEKTTKPTIAS